MEPFSEWKNHHELLFQRTSVYWSSLVFCFGFSSIFPVWPILQSMSLDTSLASSVWLFRNASLSRQNHKVFPNLSSMFFTFLSAYSLYRLKGRKDVKSSQQLSESVQDKVKLPRLQLSSHFFSRGKSSKSADGSEMLISSSCCQSGRLSKEV